MKNEWENAVITKISVAVYVPPNTGKHVHKERPYHGFVLNDKKAVRDYCFDDGRIMHTRENSLFYLPKGSSYYVKTIQSGGCYAINFDMDMVDEPFCVTLKNPDELYRHFKNACSDWKRRKLTRLCAAMRAIYHAIYQLQNEVESAYVPKVTREIIAPAMNEIEKNFHCNDLTVEGLASLCGISAVYFRKIFTKSFGVSPKEYIIQKRMEFAKQLLILRELEVSEIALLCGYGEPCHFSREFKKRVGVSPKEYA